MFVLKYVYPTGQDWISGPYEFISAEWVDSENNPIADIHNRDLPQGDPVPPIYRKINAHKPDGSSVAFGPNIPRDPNGTKANFCGRLYVMNESGATIAKYEL